MDKEIMDGLQKQFNKVNRKIQVLNNEINKDKNQIQCLQSLINVRYDTFKMKRDKESQFNLFMVMALNATIFFILGMIAYKYLALSGVIK